MDPNYLAGAFAGITLTVLFAQVTYSLEEFQAKWNIFATLAIASYCLSLYFVYKAIGMMDLKYI